MELPGPNGVVIGPRIALACGKRNAEGIYPPLSKSELSKKKEKKKSVFNTIVLSSPTVACPVAFGRHTYPWEFGPEYPPPHV